MTPQYFILIRTQGCTACVMPVRPGPPLADWACGLPAPQCAKGSFPLAHCGSGSKNKKGNQK